MPLTVIAFVSRKPGLSPSAFKSHYEDTHMPLLHSLTGPTFPLSHTRFYVTRQPSEPSPDTSNANHPPTVYGGTPSDFNYDVHIELVFESAAGMEAFYAKMQEPEVAKGIAEDEEKFIDRGTWRVAAVDEPMVTRR